MAFTGCEWIGFCVLSHEAQAAWVQAGGSILALFVAIGVPAWQARVTKKAERDKSHERARSLALLVVTDLQELQDAMGVWERQVDQDDDSLIRGNTQVFFDVPAALLANRDRLYMLGPAAPATNDAVALMLIARRELMRAKDIAQNPHRYDGETYDLDRVRHAATKLIERVDEALNQIGAMFGDPQEL